jgi:hypothetical protein
MRLIIKLEEERILEVLIIIKFENCYHAVYFLKPEDQRYINQ